MPDEEVLTKQVAEWNGEIRRLQELVRYASSGEWPQSSNDATAMRDGFEFKYGQGTWDAPAFAELKGGWTAAWVAGQQAFKNRLQPAAYRVHAGQTMLFDRLAEADAYCVDEEGPEVLYVLPEES